jgi:hypothetical protein
MLKKSFPSIESKVHPDARDLDFNYSPVTLSNHENDDLINRLLSDFSDLLEKSNDGTGEWEWLQANKQKEFLRSLVSKDIELISSFLTNMFRTEATYGYISPSYSDAIANPEQVSSDILCNIDSCVEFTDLTNLKQLSTSIGNPYGLVSDDGIILPDTPRHFYYSHIISSLIKTNNSPTILEIGGGYGGLCLENWRRFDGKCTIISIDLMPSSIVTYYFLAQNNIPVNLISGDRSKIKENSVNIICASDFKRLSQTLTKCDLIFNSRSLCEMGIDTIETYFKFINNCEVNFLYHENSNFLLFPDSKRHVEVMADDFPIDFSKFTIQSKYITPFTGGDGRYREYIYRAL